MSAEVAHLVDLQVLLALSQALLDLDILLLEFRQLHRLLERSGSVCRQRQSMRSSEGLIGVSSTRGMRAPAASGRQIVYVQIRALGREAVLSEEDIEAAAEPSVRVTAGTAEVKEVGNGERVTLMTYSSPARWTASMTGRLRGHKPSENQTASLERAPTFAVHEQNIRRAHFPASILVHMLHLRTRRCPRERLVATLHLKAVKRAEGCRSTEGCQDRPADRTLNANNEFNILVRPFKRHAPYSEQYCHIHERSWTGSSGLPGTSS